MKRKLNIKAGFSVERRALPSPLTAGKKNKYGACRVTVDGRTFDSKKEARRYGELRLLERAGQIRNLELQPKFDISVNGKHCFSYLADFAYFEGEQRIIEDAKSPATRTAVYRLKKKCVEAAYLINVREV